MAIVKVEPLTTARALRGPFDYALSDRIGEVGVGSVLVVPFGRRRVLGVVVEVAEHSELPPERLAEPIEALALGVPASLVRLGLWVAAEYCSTPARGLGLVLPPGTGRSSSRTPAPARELRASATGTARDELGSARLGSRQREVLSALAERGGEIPASQLPVRGGREVLRRLEARGLVALREVAVRRAPTVAAVGAPDVAVELTADQRTARDAIVAGLDADRPGETLLHGVTGSGKTEVYLAAAEAALARGRGVIVLVPEISLTPQTMARFQSRFGDRVALLHSRLAGGERADEWRRLSSGEATICVGPRSAIFAPVADLGLIVIDEEHDASYKQESDPRYDAREVARRRAADEGAALVAGSATPRPESWLGLERLSLPRRVDARTMPRVEILDMREASARGGPLHAQTTEALHEVGRRGEKAIVLLNRRGWSPHLECRSCGRTWTCELCDVSLVLHRGRDALRCHHCGHTESPPGACPDCGSVTLARHGAGTEQVSSLLGHAIEGLPVFRLDSDSAASAGHSDVLAGFDRAASGVLVGTQMVAKGHDFPEVTLGVVLDADATLRFPDFRAEERTFALVTQLAGRSGRGEAGGRVLVQTLAPDAVSIQAAANHDSAGFLAGELERRKALAYPPFAHLVRIELSSASDAAAQRAAESLAELVRPELPAGASMLGPAPRLRLRGRNRRQLLIKSGDRPPVVEAVRTAVESAAGTRELRGVSLSVDVDPQ